MVIAEESQLGVTSRGAGQMKASVALETQPRMKEAKFLIQESLEKVPGLVAADMM